MSLACGGVSNAEVRADLWLYGVDVAFVHRDSIAPLAIGALRCSRRVPPGTYLYRVEATASGSLVSGRVTATMDLRPDPAGFRTRGFGLSDILLASSVIYPGRLRGMAARWRDPALVPLLAPVDSGGGRIVDPPNASCRSPQLTAARMKTHRGALAVVALAALFVARTADTQVLARTDTIPEQAAGYISRAAPLSAEAVAESLSVLRTLDARVRTDAGDHAAWHRRGSVAFALALRAGQPNAPRGLDVRALRRTADESLRQARKLYPASAQYAFGLGRFLQTETLVERQVEGFGYVLEALDIGRRTGVRDTALHVETLIELGISQLGDTEKLREVRNLAAEATFLEAYLLAPSNRRSFDFYARAIVRREAWTELAGLSLSHIARSREGGWPRLILGLALQRGGDSRRARAVFDTALAMYSAAERNRFDRVERIMRPSESAEFARADSAQRALMERMVWLRDDPLWGRDDDDTRTEFLARLTYSELVGGLTDVGAELGAPLGDAYIRYGPNQPSAPVQPREVRMDPMFGPNTPNFGDIVTIGDVESFFAGYRSSFASRARPRGGGGQVGDPASLARAMAEIRGAPLRGRGWIPTAAAADSMARARAELQPSLWRNIARVRIDSLPIQAARFRGGADSVDLYIASEARVNAIRGGVSNASVRADFWLYGTDVDVARRDSIDPLAIGALRWSRRVPPGTYLYRIEATADGSLVAARATATMNLRPDPVAGFRTRGFGLSDVLLASAATYPARLRGMAARWRDISLTPLLAPVDSGADVTLVWENYDFGRVGDAARYDVAITMRAINPPKGFREIAAQVVGGLAAAVGVNRNVAQDSVVFQFDREVPHAAAFVDYVTLGFGETQPGAYMVTLRVTDRVTGATASRTTRIAIRAGPAQPRR